MKPSLNQIGDAFGIGRTLSRRYDDVLADPNVDFVHINSPIPDHAWMSIKALKAGKHVMCTVPMATTIEECEQICQLVAETGLKYMMAETVVYSREFLFIKEMYEQGELGKIQYMAASHPQDMDGWPEYWERMIPMHYATHVVSPVLGLVNGRAEYVSCFGSGTVRDDIAQKSGNRFAVESCHIKIADSDIAAHIWRFLYDTAGSIARVSTSTEPRSHSSGPGRRRTACDSHGQEARSGDPGASRGSRLCPPAAGTDSQVHAERSKMPNICRSSRVAATVVRIRTWSTSLSVHWSTIATPGPTP